MFPGFSSRKKERKVALYGTYSEAARGGFI